MIHRSIGSRHTSRIGSALAALLLLGVVPTGTRAVSANPPAKSELGGAAAAPTPANEIQGTLRLATNLTDRGEYGTAEIAFYQVLRRTDASPKDQCTALLGLARMYRKQKEMTKAAAIYEKFVKVYPDEDRVPDAWLDLGRTLRDLGAYRMAFNAFYNVINSTLRFPAQGFQHYEQLAHTAQFEIAQTHFDAGDYAEAGDYFLKVHNLDLAPADKARAQFMAAYAQQLAGKLDTAVETLKTFLVDWPDDPNAPEARYRLATLLRDLKRPQEAMNVTLQLLRDVKARDKANPRLWSYWQRRTGNEIANDFFQQGDVLNALAIYQRLAGLSEDAAWRLPVTYQVALCYERLGQTDRATAAYQAVIAAGTPSGGGPPPSADLQELAQMASWRLAHLRWEDKTEHEFSTLFPAPTTPAKANGKPALSPAASPPPS